MGLENVFRMLVMSSVVLNSILLFSSLGQLQIDEIQAYQNYGSTLPNLWLSLLSSLWIVAPLLLLTFKKKARSVFVLVVVADLLSTLFSGLNIFTPEYMLLLQASLILDGVLVTLTFTSLSHRYSNGV